MLGMSLGALMRLSWVSIPPPATSGSPHHAALSLRWFKRRLARSEHPPRDLSHQHTMLRPQPELVDQPVPKACRVNDSKARSQGTDADRGFKDETVSKTSPSVQKNRSTR